MCNYSNSFPIPHGIREIRVIRVQKKKFLFVGKIMCNYSNSFPIPHGIRAIREIRVQHKNESSYGRGPATNILIKETVILNNNNHETKIFT